MFLASMFGEIIEHIHSDCKFNRNMYLTLIQSHLSWNKDLEGFGGLGFKPLVSSY